MNWRDHVRTRLLDIRSASVLALDEQAHTLAGSVLPATSVMLQDNRPHSPCALALGVAALDGLNAQQAQHLISQTRLYGAPRILLVVPFDCALDETTFRALGFALSATDTAENRRIHYYDLDTYKTVPDWLNARHWANPERWEP
jgi:hypothetical protein